MITIRWWVGVADALWVAASDSAWAQNTLDAQALKLYGGTYSVDCGDNNTVLLYSAAQGVVYGKVVQQPRASLIGAPPPAVATELERLWLSEWRQK